jgi:hypothetical protein
MYDTLYSYALFYNNVTYPILYVNKQHPNQVWLLRSADTDNKQMIIKIEFNFPLTGPFTTSVSTSYDRCTATQMFRDTTATSISDYSLAYTGKYLNGWGCARQPAATSEFAFTFLSFSY